MIISDVMTPCPYKISFEKSMEEAIKFFELRNIRHLPVVKEDEVVGLLSLRDVELGKFLCESTGLCPSAGDLCVSDPYVVANNTPIGEVTQAMADKKTDCALVVDPEGNFVGIFTTTDACRLVKMLLDQKQ